MMTFEQAWAVSSQIPGWYTEAEARLLWNCALSCPPPHRVLEIGAYKGRSTTLLAQAEPERLDIIDPFILAPGNGNDTPQSEGRYIHQETASGILAEFTRNMNGWPYHLMMTKASEVDHSRLASVYSLIHVDADHVEGVFHDIQLVRGWLRPGGVVVFHDYKPLHTPHTNVKEAVLLLARLTPVEILGQVDSSIACRRVR